MSERETGASRDHIRAITCNIWPIRGPSTGNEAYIQTGKLEDTRQFITHNNAFLGEDSFLFSPFFSGLIREGSSNVIVVFVPLFVNTALFFFDVIEWWDCFFRTAKIFSVDFEFPMFLLFLSFEFFHDN